jgi:hypothetical protein
MNDIEYIQYLRKQAVALKFSLPANFKRYNSKRLLRCYNGIGAEWMPAWLRDFVTDIFFILQAAALIHDFEYTHGKKSYWNFTVANVRFAYNAARSHRLVIGIAGALLCQVFGWYAYTHSKEISPNGTP